MVSAVRVDRIVRSMHRGKVVTSSIGVEWRHGTIVREEAQAVGIVPAKTTLWNNADRSLWILDKESQSAGPTGMSLAQRDMLAADLGLALDSSRAIRMPPGPLLVEERAAASPEGALKGQGSSFVVRSRGSVTQRLWVVKDLPLTSADYAAGLRRRLSPPWSADEERLLAAFASLPGYPVHVASTKGEYAVVNAVRSMVIVSVPASLFAVPETYERVEDGLQLLLERAMDSLEEKQQRGLAKLGLDRPFVPSRARPLPPALPGGSCIAKRGECVETWDGVATFFSWHCDPPFEQGACSRNGVTGVCESQDRTMLKYFQRHVKEPKKICAGQFYRAPAARQP